MTEAVDEVVALKGCAKNMTILVEFYLTYPEEEICYTLCSKLNWSHNRLIMRV